MFGLLLVPIALAILLFFAAYEGAFGLSLDHNVRISDSLTVVCTAVLALTLQYFFARRNTYERDQRELISDSIKSLLASLQDLRESVLYSMTGIDLTVEQAQKIVYGFDCCFDSILMLELAFEVPDSTFLKRKAGDLAGMILASKQSITGGDFPKRKMTYAEVELLSVLRREIAKKLTPLYLVKPEADSVIIRQWRQLKLEAEKDRVEWWK